MTNIERFVFEDVQTGDKFELVDTGERGCYYRWVDKDTTKSLDREKFEKLLAAFRRDKYFEEV